MKARRIVGLAILAALAFPGVARAHATLVRSSPPDRAVLGAAPRGVRLFFDDDVRAAGGIKAIRNGGGSVLDGQARVVHGRTLVVPLGRIGDGDYSVLWRVVSDDGHTIAGVTTFAVGVGRAPPRAALTASNGPSARDVISRWLLLAGLLAAGGGALFRLATGTGTTRPLLPAFVLVFLGSSGLAGHGSLASRFDIVMAVATVLAGVGGTLAALCAFYERLAWPAWAAALLLLPVPSLAGHALDAGRPRIEVPIDVLHVAAASFWAGGLLQLLLLLRRGRARTVLPAFSRLALLSVVTLSLTGVIRAFAELGGVSQVWSTGYGQLLIVKTALLAVLVVLGWLNRSRLLPHTSLRGLRRSVSVELVLLAGLVVAVAILTGARPGRDRVAQAAIPAAAPPPLPPRNALVLAQEDGELGVLLAASPVGTGQALRLTVTGPAGLGVSGLGVSIGGRLTSSCGAGCYSAAPSAPVRELTAEVQGRKLSFQLSGRWPPRPAAQLVARATTAFRGLRSAAFVERLASSPKNRIVSRFTLEAPNRLEYRIRGGNSGIVIGPHRWDRAAGGDWVPSTSSLLPQPLPIWEGRITNAFLLDETPRSYLVSFLNPELRAAFRLRLDRRTLLPVDLSMTATAHFMRHRYTGFDFPRRIRPPR